MLKISTKAINLLCNKQFDSIQKLFIQAIKACPPLTSIQIEQPLAPRWDPTVLHIFWTETVVPPPPGKESLHDALVLMMQMHYGLN